MKKAIFSFSLLAACAAAAAPLWKASEPDSQSVVLKLSDSTELRVDVLSENLFRVRKSWTNCWTESGMNRYGILKADWPKTAFTRSGNVISTAAAECSVDPAKGTLHVKSRVSAADFTVAPRSVGKGFSISFSIAKDERIYGLGDCSRDEIMRRGKRYEIWVKNVKSYIPMPVAISRSGWGVLLNSTWRHFWDVGAKDPCAMTADAPQGEIDFYVFLGKDYPALLDIYTQLSGRSALLPVWGYGFTYVANQNIDQYNVINECMQFRDRGLPCDVYGLEPGWMSKFYDGTVYKEWNSDRFYFPYWAPAGGHTWIGAMKRIGMKLSLWLCCDYDLFRYEEQCAAGLAKKFGKKVEVPDDITETWEDDRINPTTNKTAKVKKTSHHKNKMYLKLKCPEDDVPEGMLPWFEHLKKFVDQGAQCFKLDGSNQIGEHPKRAWANGHIDEEMHNLYPAVYDKQMARGYEEYTGRRAMVYSAGGYAGIQQYVATWAGDTGGGPKPLASLLNLAISGHSNQSCDMSIFSVDSLHFGFLQTWSQQNNWDYWNQPWIQEQKGLETFRQYARLRYRLLPYLYTSAATAARTGWPVMRALAIAYPDEPKYDTVMTTYMLGPDLLVSAFAKTVSVPKGLWHEWRTGAKVSGPVELPVEKTPEWGGSLYVRAGAIIPTWPVKQHVEYGFNDEVVFEVWPSAPGKSELYEDDGTSLNYRAGKFAVTALELSLDGEKASFVVSPRKGVFAGMPKTRRLAAAFHLDRKPTAVQVDGKSAEGEWDENAKVFRVDLGERAGGASVTFVK
jgi:alpha-glucosidase (family GH31 glycosyl hydrolase)